MRRGVYWLLLLLLAGPATGAGIYRWTDAEGRVHFGDAPPDERQAEGVALRYNAVGSTPVPAGMFESRPPVVMYSAAWCGVCRKAKCFLQARSVPFHEYDIETTRKGREDYRRLQGTGVPIILVGAERMNGFNAATLTGWLEQAGHLPATP
ncbi:glutaredoxin family protein [Sulfurivermis fontis]|uniref:glutaredoxin family protein n=1 Tax=Sulfurivermis fontis TaxID=1972068 RepID=UPI000FDC56D4|nr:glutaredoxin family protein [Sulfurivermis fontis]